MGLLSGAGEVKMWVGVVMKPATHVQKVTRELNPVMEPKHRTRTLPYLHETYLQCFFHFLFLSQLNAIVVERGGVLCVQSIPFPGLQQSVFWCDLVHVVREVSRGLYITCVTH